MTVRKDKVILYVIGVLLLLGIVVSNTSGLNALDEVEYTCQVSACDIVKQSPYSKIGGISISVLGSIYYWILTISMLISMRKKNFINKVNTYLLGAGLAFGLYVRYLEIFKIHAWCELCVLGYAIMIIIAILYAYYTKKYAMFTESDS